MSKLGVKFVKGGKVFAFDDNNLNIPLNTNVVVETVRGIEIGMTCKAPLDDDTEEIKSLIRVATEDDLKNMDDLKKQESNVLNLTNKLIEKYKLDMKLVDASFTLDGTKVIINYICEDRVDFRELVKDLASQLHLRIELRQIGIRDQAKKIGGIGFCGRECCCKKYLNDFDKVSIKMAKTQGLSLNPTKISGICGRLMCCLSYENDFYSEIAVKMPKLNSKVKTKDGNGVVVYNNLLKQKVTVRIENDNEIKVNEYELSEIEIIPKDKTMQIQQKQPNIDKTSNQSNDIEKEKNNTIQTDKKIENSNKTNKMNSNKNNSNNKASKSQNLNENKFTNKNSNNKNKFKKKKNK